MGTQRLQHLVQIVVRELEASRSRLPHETGLTSSAARCTGERSAVSAADLAPCIDHTLLKPDAAQRDIEALCREAWEHRFATVCVNPTWVPLCVRALAGSGVGVCSVVGFPLGATTEEVKQYEASRAVDEGASEIDMVINIGALKSHDVRRVVHDVQAVVRVCRHARARTKVILEVALLTPDEKVAACTLAKAAGADYVKTSTGFGPGGATSDDVALMRRVVGEEVGVKAAGGIRDLATLRQMLLAGATRIGTSAGVRILREAAGMVADEGESIR